MAAGLPAKTNWATNDVFTSAGVDDLAGTVNLLGLSTVTATAAGTTVLTVASHRKQTFTGTTTQTVTLPVVSTLSLGDTFEIDNSSTGIVTVQSSGANSVLAMATMTRAVFVCVLITGTTAASWTVAAVVSSSSSGLVLIKRATLTTASNSSTTFDGVFTSTYKMYKIIIDGLTLSTGDAYLYLQYRASAVTKNAAVYSSWGRTLPTSASYDWTTSAATQNILSQGGPGADSLGSVDVILDWQNYPNFYGNIRNGYRGVIDTVQSAASLNATTDGFILSTSAGTVTANISVYGLAIV